MILDESLHLCKQLSEGNDNSDLSGEERDAIGIVLRDRERLLAALAVYADHHNWAAVDWGDEDEEKVDYYCRWFAPTEEEDELLDGWSIAEKALNHDVREQLPDPRANG